MSSSRINRNIRHISSIHSQNISQELLDNCLGENITNNSSETPINSLSSNSDIDEFGLRLSGLSSSSSLSWSEEYDLEVTKKVKTELEKLDRIIQGIETDPTPYDVEEINEWKHFFPHIYILGHHTPTNSPDSSCVSSEEEAPIRKPQKQSKHFTTFKSHQHDFPQYHSLPRKPRSLDIDRYLKVSPIKSSDTRHRIVNKPVESKDKPKDVSPEYISLPFLTTIPIKTENLKRFDRTKQSKLLFLPPIENSFRSISATPRQAVSGSVYVPFGYQKRNSLQRNVAEYNNARTLKSSLLTLFDHIPLSNR